LVVAPTTTMHKSRLRCDAQWKEVASVAATRSGIGAGWLSWRHMPPFIYRRRTSTAAPTACPALTVSPPVSPSLHSSPHNWPGTATSSGAIKIAVSELIPVAGPSIFHVATAAPKLPSQHRQFHSTPPPPKHTKTQDHKNTHTDDFRLRCSHVRSRKWSPESAGHVRAVKVACLS
jgi:hypothetical protein